MKGSLSPGAMPVLLGQLHAGRKSGLLQMSRGAENIFFRFIGGQIVQAVSGDAGREALLDVLDWTGPAYYSFEENAENVPPPGEITMRTGAGDVILEAVRRMSDPEAVRAALGDLDRVLLPSSDPMLRFQNLPFTPGDGYTLSRIDGTSTAAEVIQLIPLPSEEVEKSLFSLLCTGVIEYAIKAKARRPPQPPPAHAPPPAPVEPPSAAPPKKPAGPPPPSPAELRKKEIDTRRMEILEAFDGLKEKTHFEVLGIPKASNLAQVKEAYFRLARRFHPDTQKHPELADLTDRLEAVFIRVGEAYEVLRNPRSRSQYEEYIKGRQPRNAPVEPGPEAAPEPLMAVRDADAELPNPYLDSRAALESVRRAEKMLDDNQTWDAIQLVQGALPSLEGKARHHANVLLAKAFLRNPKWVRRAEDTLLKVTQEAPKHVEAHFVLAGIYKERGLPSRAASMYRKVMELQPDHEGAQRALAELAPPEPEPPPPSGGGLLKKLFGRG
jgi:tetratricopeptide (TPR) repeat protein